MQLRTGASERAGIRSWVLWDWGPTTSFRSKTVAVVKEGHSAIHRVVRRLPSTNTIMTVGVGGIPDYCRNTDIPDSPQKLFPPSENA